MAPCRPNPKGEGGLRAHSASLFLAVALLRLVIVPSLISARPLRAAAPHFLNGPLVYCKKENGQPVLRSPVPEGPRGIFACGDPLPLGRSNDVVGHAFGGPRHLTEEILGALGIRLGGIPEILVVGRVRLTAMLVLAPENAIVLTLFNPRANLGDAQHVEGMALAHHVQHLEHLVGHVARLPVLLGLDDELVEIHLHRHHRRPPS